MDRIVFVIAILPAVLLLLHINKKDCRRPEPKSQLVKAFLLGLLSIPLSLAISIPMGMLGLYTESVESYTDAFCISFFGASIPEESAKLIILWLFLRKNRHFDEKMDGIVYAVCVSMGFAALENVMYLFQNYDTFMEVGIVRAFTAVPAHFFFGILMGYFYSLAHFRHNKRGFYIAMTFMAPVLAHGIYDYVAFSTTLEDGMATMLTFLFYAICIYMWKIGKWHISKHLERDTMMTHGNPEEANADIPTGSVGRNGYTPSPIDISGIELPEELDEAVETIAKNVHEVWAKERMSEGWTYGPVRNDALKQHPCLVPYEELPEIEKEYDRNTAIGTLKHIKGLGFNITKE